MYTFIISVLIFITSFLFAMLGLGGGMVYIPILKWTGLNYKEVVIPLGLLLNGLNTLLALIPYHKAKLVDYRGMWPMGLTAMIFSPIGALVTPLVSNEILIIIFANLVIVAAVKVLYDVYKSRKEKSITSTNKQEMKVETISTEKGTLGRKQRIGALIGAVVGFIGGLLGVGGGFIIAPVLMALGYETKKAAATTAFVVSFSSFSGYLGHIRQGIPNTWLIFFLIVAVILGSQIGSRFMIWKVKGSSVKAIYGILLLFIAIKLYIEVV